MIKCVFLLNHFHIFSFAIIVNYGMTVFVITERTCLLTKDQDKNYFLKKRKSVYKLFYTCIMCVFMFICGDWRSNFRLTFHNVIFL